MLTNKRIGRLSAAIVGVLGLAAPGFAAVLVDFKPNPSTEGPFIPGFPAIPEVKYDGGAPKQLVADVGAQGNSDIATAGGLQIETPVGLLSLPPAYAPSVIQNPAGGTTTFLDVELVLSGLFQMGAAIQTDIAPGIKLLTQPLTAGEFRLESYDPPGPEGKILLLAGTIKDAVISGVQGSTTGAVLSANVEYTAGLIYDAMPATLVKKGELSFSLLDITAPLSASGVPLTLNSFVANLVGQFSAPAIPEPTSLGMLALAGLGLLRRRSR